MKPRQLPSSIESEKGLIGSALITSKQLPDMLALVTEEDFHHPSHQILWQLIVEQFNGKKPIDLITITQLAEDKKLLSKVGGAAYITEMFCAVPSASNWKYYCEIVKEKSACRKAIQIATDILEAAYDPAADMSITEAVQSGLIKVAGLTQSSAETTSIKEIMVMLADEFEEIATSGRKKTGILSGIGPLDKKTHGFQPGNMIVIAAATKVGKTSLALNIGLNVAMAGSPVGIFSLEMNKLELGRRLIAAQSGYNINSVGDEPISQHNCSKIMNAIAAIAETNIHIRDEADMTMTQFRSAAHRMVMRDDVKLIILDYAQLVIPSNKKETREQQVAEVSRTVKLTAGELGIPIIILSQINDDGRSRESRSLENDANIFMVVEKEKAGKTDDDGFNYYLNLKHTRDCPSGRIPLSFRNEITKFEERIE